MKRIRHCGDLSAFDPSLHRAFKRCGLLSWIFCSSLAICLLAGCESTREQAPVSNRTVPGRDRVAEKPEGPGKMGAPRSSIHTVKKGDTLYSIATSNGIHPKDLAEWNNISDPGALYIGQELSLFPPVPLDQPLLYAVREPTPPSTSAGGGETAYPPEAKILSNTTLLKTEPKAFKLPYSQQALVQLQKGVARPPSVLRIKVDPAIEKNTRIELGDFPPAPSEAVPSGVVPPGVVPRGTVPPGVSPREAAPEDDRVDWSWPAKGKVSGLFSEGTKGIDISGLPGQAVTASAAGKVVYSGAGLRGYGKLIIIKHNNTYLSAYAHNSKLLVKEGETVAKGQKIAEMGNTDSNLVKLHFEIRKNGKPVDPLKHLPGVSG
jgi:lipoprotein NlpD